MKTVAINIENLCAPCHNSCRHCLLNSKHNITGVEYLRGESFARNFYGWLNTHRPDLGGMYYVGYCMDFPEMNQYAMYFCEQTGMHHFMFDGMGFRTEDETREMLRQLQIAGISELHFTFYGSEDYHDRFAGRLGDYQFMILTAKIARQLGMKFTSGIMVTAENVDQIDNLYLVLQKEGFSRISLLMPHGKGRGYNLSAHRLTEELCQRLPEEFKPYFLNKRYRAEAEWLASGNFSGVDARYLTLSITPDNIDRLEKMHPANIIAELEAMDDWFYSNLPDVETLARMYGDTKNMQLFRFRDLYIQWQRRYLMEHPIEPDMTDERYSFSTYIFQE